MSTCKVINSEGKRCGRDVTFWHAEELCAAHKHRMLTHGTYDADRPVRNYTKSDKVRGGGEITPGTTPSERFWNRVSKGICWNWLGPVLNSGYGAMWDGRRTTTAHRFSWTELNGEIPKGAQVRQTCSNPLCVNPKHLELKLPISQRQGVAA